MSNRDIQNGESYNRGSFVSWRAGWQLPGRDSGSVTPSLVKPGLRSDIDAPRDVHCIFSRIFPLQTSPGPAALT